MSMVATLFLGGDTMPSKEKLLQYQKSYLRKHPWAKTWKSINGRCNDKTGRYMKMGIKNLISVNELKKIWFRDSAFLLKQPSIDRINNKGNYEFKNCRYIELLKNNKQGGINRWKMYPFSPNDRSRKLQKCEVSNG